MMRSVALLAAIACAHSAFGATTEAPATEAPATEAPATEAATTEAAATEALSTEAPATEAPTTEALTTEAPVTEAPATEAATTQVPMAEVTGTISMTVPDASFKDDQAAQDAVREGIAQVAGVPASAVALTIDEVASLLRRLLAGSTFTVGYTITISTAEASQVETALTDASVDEVNGAVKSKVEAVKGASYVVTVAEKSPVTSAPAMTTEAPNTEAPATEAPATEAPAEPTSAEPTTATPTAPPSNPCTTTAPSTCASFACLANSVTKTDFVFCGNADGPECSSHLCCNTMTTVTTTPAPTCESFTCPHGWNKKGENTICATGECDKATCCAVEVPPCTTVTTTPALTCSSYTCPDGYFEKAGSTICRMGKCDSATCCMAIITTVTTTPAPTCESFTCSHGWNKKEKTTVCATGTCDKATCCAAEVPPCTTVTTTPALTCSSYTCPDGYSENAASTICQMGKCDSATCCMAIITTVTTTPAPTCESYFKTHWLPQWIHATCPKGFSKVSDSTVCPKAECNKATCCSKTAPLDPCAPAVVQVQAVGRKYDSKESVRAQEAAASKKEASMMPAWALPLLGVVAMFFVATFVAVGLRRSQRSTRMIRVPQDAELGDACFLSDDGPVE